MIGNYQAVAAAVGPDVPAVPVWIDTRSGNPDPFITRVGISSNVVFRSWRAARFSSSQIGNAAVGAANADPEGDGTVNMLEYAFGLNPWQSDKPAVTFAVTGSGFSNLVATTHERLRTAADLSYSWTRSTNLT